MRHSTHMPPMQHTATAHTCTGTHAQHSSTAAHTCRGTAQQHSTHTTGQHYARHSTNNNCLSNAGGWWAAQIYYLFNMVVGVVVACSTAQALNNLWGWGYRVVPQGAGHSIIENKKQKRIFNIGVGGLNNYLFKVQGTVKAAAVRAMNRAEKSDFSAVVVCRMFTSPRHHWAVAC